MHVGRSAHAAEQDVGEAGALRRQLRRHLGIAPGLRDVAGDLAAPAETQRLVGIAAGRRKVLEEPVELAEVSRADPKIEIGKPLADPKVAREVQARRREPERGVLEADAPVHDGQRGSSGRRHAEAASHHGRGGPRLDRDRSPAACALDAPLGPVQRDRERERAGEARARKLDVAEEPLDRDASPLDREAHGRRLPGRPRQLDPQGSGRLASLVARPHDVGDQRSGGRDELGLHALEGKRARVDPRGREAAGEAEAARRRHAQLPREPRLAAEAESRPEETLDLGDVDARGDREQRQRMLQVLHRAGQRELAEAAGDLGLLQHDSPCGIQPEAQVERADDGLGVGKFERRLARVEQAAVAVAREGGDLHREPLHPPAEPRLAALELEQTLLHDELADAELKARALALRPGQPGRQVPGSVRELDEGDARAVRAHASEPQLSARQRDPSADRQLVGGEQRLGGKARVVRDRDVGELNLRRKDPETDAPEVDRPLEKLGEPLLRDALDQPLEAVGVPDRVGGEDQEEEDEPEQAHRREALRLARRMVRLLSLALGHALRTGAATPLTVSSSRSPAARRAVASQTPQESFSAS